MYGTPIKNCETATSQVKWNEIFIDVNWKKTYDLVFNISKDTYLQWFQTRILHRILGVKSLQFRMNITSDNLCTFCNEHEETLIHLFWECKYSKEIITYVSNILRQNKILPQTGITCQDLLLGVTKTRTHEINILFLEIKRFLYICKQKKTLQPKV